MRMKKWIPAFVLGILLIGIVTVKLNPEMIVNLTGQRGKQYSQEVRLENVIEPDEAVVPLSEVRETLSEAYEQHYGNLTLPEYAETEIPDELGVYQVYDNTIPFENWEKILATMFAEGTFLPEERVEREFTGDWVYYDFDSRDNLCRASIMNNGEVTLTYDEEGFIGVSYSEFWFYHLMSGEEKARYSEDEETVYAYLEQYWETYGLETGYTVVGIADGTMVDGTPIATIYITEVRDGLLYDYQGMYKEDQKGMYYGGRTICFKVNHETHELIGLHLQVGIEERIQTVNSILPLKTVLELVEEKFAAKVYLVIRDVHLIYTFKPEDEGILLIPVWCIELEGNEVIGDGQYVYVDALDGTVTATFVDTGYLY